MTMRYRHTLTLPLVVLAAGCWGPPALASKSDGEKLLFEGKIATKKGNTDEAYQKLLRAVEEDPSNVEAQFELASLRFRLGEYSTAERQFRKLLKDGKVANAKVLPMLAGAWLAEGKLKKVLETVPCADDMDCKGEILALHARALLSQHDLKGASAEARAALEATPEGLSPRIAQAMVLSAGGDWAGAEALVDAVLDVRPTLPEVLKLKGELRGFAGDLQGAIAAFRASLASNQTDVGTRVSLIMALFAGNADAEANREIDTLLAQIPPPNEKLVVPDSSADPEDIAQQEDERLSAVSQQEIFGRYLKAMYLMRAEKPQDALNSVRPVELFLAKAAPRSSYLMAVIYAGTHNLEQGLKYAGQFHKYFPDDIAGVKLLARLTFQAGDYQRVIESLGHQQDRIADDGETLNILGSSYLAEGRIEEANRILTQAAKILPDDPMTQARLGVALAGKRQTHEEGVHRLEELMRTNPDNARVGMALFGVYFGNGEYQRAIDAATEMEKQKPASPLPLNLRGTAEVSLGRDDAARHDFQAALAKDQKFAPAALSLAQLEMRHGDGAAARAVLDAILAGQPAHPGVLMARANLEIRLGRPAAAVPFLKTAIAAHPKDPDPRVALLHAQLALGERTQALAMAKALAQDYPDSANLVDLAATICMRLGEPQTGLQMFQDLETRNPNSAALTHRYGQMLASAGRLEEARAKFSRSVAEAPDFLAAWIDLAMLERHVTGLPAAMTVVQKAQAHNPKSAVASVLGGDVLRAAGKLPEAEQVYREVHGKTPSSVSTSRLFRIQLQQGHRPQALATIQGWLQAHPGDVLIRMELAEENIQAGETKAAIEQYELLASKLPRDARVLNNLAWVYDRVNDPRAINAAERAYQLAPDATDVLDTYAYLLFRKGDKRTGAELLRQAYGTDPRSPDIAFHMAVVLADANDPDGAKKILKGLIDSHAHFNDAENARQLYGKLGGS